MTFITLLWLMGAGQVVAPPALDESERQRQAKVLLDVGLKHYGAAEYEPAIEAFKAAYALAPAPGLLFNIAQAYRLWGKGHCLEAARTYQTYLQASPDASNRSKVEAQLKGLERCAKEEEATQPPEPAKAVEAPRPADATPKEPPAASDTPVAEASRPEETKPVPAPPVAADAAPAPAAVSPPGVEARPARPVRWPALAVGAAGLVAVGVGGGLYGWAGQDYAGFQSQCATGQCAPSVWESARMHEQVGLALLGAGAVVVVAGAIWWFLVSGGQ